MPPILCNKAFFFRFLNLLQWDYMNSFFKIILSIILVVGVGAGIYWYSNIKQTAPIEQGTTCTMEAKLCPDGSSVGRTGPNCTFPACPPVNTTVTKSGIKGNVLLGPTCPVVQNPPEPGCADKPYQTSLLVKTPDNSRVIAHMSSGTDGKFSVDVPAGSYIITQAGTGLFPRCGSNGTITVQSNNYTDTAVYCDTGIR